MCCCKAAVKDKPKLGAIMYSLLITILIVFNAMMLAEYGKRTGEMEDDIESQDALLLSQINECMGGGKIAGSDRVNARFNSVVRALLYENYNNIKIMLISWFSLFGCLAISPLCIYGGTGETKDNITNNCYKCKEFKNFFGLYMRYN